MRRFIVACFLFAGTLTFGQGKELTLNDAVMEQYRGFYPTHTFGVQWIPGEDAYSMIEKYSTLVKVDAKSGKKTVLASLESIKTETGLKLNYLTAYEWKGNNTIFLSDGQQFAYYDLAKKTGGVYATIEGENALNHMVSKQVAFTVDNNVWMADRSKKWAVTQHTDKNIVAGGPIARSEFGIKGGLFFSENGNYLAFYEKNETNVADYPLLDVTTTPGQLKSIKYPMAGQKSEQPKVGVYNVKSGKTVYIKPTGNEDDYLTNLSFTNDEKFVVIAEVNRDQNHMRLNVFDAETGTFVKTLFEEKNNRWVEPEHAPFFLDGKNNEFLWISERDGFNNLYHYDFNGKLIAQLTSNKFVIKNIDSYTGGKIFFNATGESPLNTMLYSVDLKGKQTLVTKISGTHSAQVSSNGKWIYDAYSNHDIPNQELILNAEGKTIRTVLTAENKLTEYVYGSADLGTIDNGKGTTLYTRLIKPSNFDPHTKYPVLVYVYGGPHAQLITNSWLDGANLWMYWMAEQGYLVFTVDGRGSAERGFEFESVIHRQLGVAEMEDQIAGVDYLKSLKYVDGNRIAVHGWSFGGFMTTNLLLTHPGVFTCGVAGGPVTDWKYYEIMYGERYMDSPEQNPEGYKSTSLIEKAGNLKDDLLLIHGTMDDVVVMQHNYALIKKFVDLGIQVDFFPYPTHLHNVRGKDRVHLMTKILNYVIEKNK